MPSDGDVHSLCSRRPNTLGPISIAYRLQRTFRQYRPNAVIAHTPYTNVIALLVVWVLRTPICIAAQHSPTGAFPRLWRRLDEVLGSTSAYTCCVAVAETVKQLFKSHSAAYHTKVVVIPNGVDTAPESTTPAESPFLQNVPVLINVGRMSQSKRHTMQIDVVDQFQSTGLIIVDDGELRESVEDLVRTRELEDGAFVRCHQATSPQTRPECHD